MKEQKPTARGFVLEMMPDLKFRVQLDDDKEVLCYLSGKMKLNKIRVLVGDNVVVELDPFGGKGTNRIIRRV